MGIKLCSSGGIHSSSKRMTSTHTCAFLDDSRQNAVHISFLKFHCKYSVIICLCNPDLGKGSKANLCWHKVSTMQRKANGVW